MLSRSGRDKEKHKDEEKEAVEDRLTEKKELERKKKEEKQRESKKAEETKRIEKKEIEKKKEWEMKMKGKKKSVSKIFPQIDTIIKDTRIEYQSLVDLANELEKYSESIKYSFSLLLPSEDQFLCNDCGTFLDDLCFHFERYVKAAVTLEQLVMGNHPQCHQMLSTLRGKIRKCLEGSTTDVPAVISTLEKLTSNILSLYEMHNVKLACILSSKSSQWQPDHGIKNGKGFQECTVVVQAKTLEFIALIDSIWNASNATSFCSLVNQCYELLKVLEKLIMHTSFLYHHGLLFNETDNEIKMLMNIADHCERTDIEEQVLRQLCYDAQSKGLFSQMDLSLFEQSSPNDCAVKEVLTLVSQEVIRLYSSSQPDCKESSALQVYNELVLQTERDLISPAADFWCNNSTFPENPSHLKAVANDLLVSIRDDCTATASQSFSNFCLSQIKTLKFIVVEDECVKIADFLGNVELFKGNLKTLELLTMSFAKPEEDHSFEQSMKMIEQIHSACKDVCTSVAKLLQSTTAERNFLTCFSVLLQTLSSILKNPSASDVKVISDACKSLNSVIYDLISLRGLSDKKIGHESTPIKEPGSAHKSHEIVFFVVVRCSLFKLTCVPHVYLSFCQSTSVNLPDSSLMEEDKLLSTDEYYVMTRKLLFDTKDVRGKQFLYKYLIFCQHFDESSEYISCGNGNIKDNYRVLKFGWNTEAFKLQKIDSCVYPIEYREENKIKKFTNYLDLTTRAVKVPETHAELNFCFDVFTQNVMLRLKRCEISDWQMLIEDYNTILSLYNSFLSAEKCSSDFKNPPTKFFDHRECAKIFIEQLMKVTEDVKREYQPEKVFTFLFFARVFEEMLPVKEVVQLLTLLPSDMQYVDEYEMITCSKDTCQDKGQVKMFLDCMNQVVLKGMSIGKFQNRSWINAHPFRSFFCFHDCHLQPFSKIEFSPKALRNVFDKLATDFRNNTVENEGALKHCLSSLNGSILSVDPLLGFSFFFMCHVKDYSLLIEHVPVVIVLSGIEWKLNCVTKHSQDEMIQQAYSCISMVWHHQANENKYFSAEVELHIPSSIASLVFSVFQTLKKSKALKQSSKFEKFLSECVQIISAVEERSSYYCDGSSNGLIKMVDTMEKWVKLLYGENIAVKIVIQEHQFWKRIANFVTQTRWQQTVHKAVRSRIKQMSFRDKVKAFEILTTHNSCEQDVFIDELENLIDLEAETADVKELELMIAGSNIKSVRLICNVMEKKYASKGLDLDSIFSWDLWPGILKAYKDSQKFGERSKALCEDVKKFILQILVSVSKGIASLSDLEYYTKNKQPLYKLLEVLDLNVNDFKSSVSNMKELFNLFLYYFELCWYFCTKFSDVLKGTEMMQKYSSIQNQVCSIPVNQLCILEDEKYSFPCLEQFALPTDMIVQFAIFTSSNLLNDLFYKQWKHSIKGLDQTITVQTIYNDVWIPLFHYCEELVNLLKEKKIMLKKLESLFGGNDEAINCKEISRLTSAVSLCNKCSANHFKSCWIKLNENKVSCAESSIRLGQEDESWISALSKQISRWTSYKRFSSVANLVTTILNNLEVNPISFAEVKIFSSEDLQDTALCSLSMQTEFALEFLKECSSQQNEKHLEAIRVLSESKELVKWIQTKSEDYHEMQRFIEVTMDTVSEEGDVVQDRLSDLQDLCGKFSKILYQFDNTSCSINYVVYVFREIFKSLRAMRNPLATVESCRTNIVWYSKVEELQGSVELGTKRQLEDINSLGVYHIEVDEATYMTELYLKVEEKTMSLDDLLELESKLILITRPNSSWNDEKDKFQSMLAGVMKTKQRIQKLKEYGYLGKLEVNPLSCNKFSSDLMDNMADYYEKILVDWILYVWTCRQKYYQLNFYTTQQLVTLRHEITKIKNSSADNLEVNPIVFNLLQSVTGKEEYSTMLLRKALDEDIEDADEEESCEEEVKPTPAVESSGESEASLESTKIQKAIEELTEKQAQLYYDVKKDYSHHPDFLILESIFEVEDCEECDVFTIGTRVDEMSVDMNDDEDFTASMSMKWGLSTSNQNLTIGFDTQQSLEDSWKNIEIVEDDTPLDADLSTIVSAFIPFKNSKCASSSRQFPERNCISLEELGFFLKNIVRKRGLIEIQRSMERKYIEDGYPNLLVVPPGDVYSTILKIYAEDKTEPLPGFEEVLLCSPETLLEEVVVFWMRALYDNQTGRIYCLVHGEKLPYLVAEKAIDILKVLQRQRKSFRLIILCSNEGEDRSHIISCLHANRRQFDTITYDDKQNLKKYLNHHITKKFADVASDNSLSALDVYASSVDQDSSRIRIVLSEQCGVGKSLYVRRLKDKLQNLLFQKKLDPNNVLPIITVPLHGPLVSAEDLLQILFQQIALSQGKLETKSTLEHVKNNYKSTIVHLDIPEKVLPTIDDILFSVLILKGLSDTNGRIWRCLNTQLYVVEVNRPSDQSHIFNRPEVQRIVSLLELLPTVTCVRPSEVLQQKNDGIVKIDAVEVQTPMYQRVFQYLKKLDSTDSLEQFVYYGILDDHYSDEECLKTILSHIRLKNPTWKEIRHFVWFFNVQLSSCENSSMLNTVKGLKSFVVKFLKAMSTDFATSAMTTTGENLLELHALKRAWGNNPEPYIFFNIDRRSITHTGLGVSNEHPNKPVLVNLSTKCKIDIETESEVYSFLKKRAEVPFFSSLSSVQHDSVPEALLVQRLAQFMGLKSPETVTKPDETYVLTNDNFVKIIGLQMRFRCQIPVVLMGETGCGKTHLIRFMCKFAAHGKNLKNMFILKVHGGTKEKDVINCLKDAMAAAEKNRLHKVQTVVFFDEANTSEVIGLIKEIMCDGRCNGEPFPPFLKFVAACNPYRSHSVEMIKRLASAGLGWRSSESTEKLGDIPLRDLVYRVHDLPPSMRALVYDFGALPGDKEKEYINQIVKTRAKLLKTTLSEEMIYAIANVLCECQNYMRARNDECSFVSLRDIERVIVVFIYFCEVFIPKFALKSEVEALHGSIESLSLVLAVGVCYHAKMEKRTNFEDALCRAFRPPLAELKPRLMSDVLKRCQEALLDHMIIQDNIARNKALRENIFMMFVCVELRIPLFLVGKPGSSKSLAKTIIQSSMKGEHSKTQTMQEFKQVHMHSHQCSPMSTPSSITEVFSLAKKLQMKKNTSSFVSVVVLDEVGLAEASPFLPLKALHPLLEDGVEGSGSDDHRVDREERVAFIGISNWALDPAKMNRGIMVTRGDPGIDDLIDSAIGICSNIQSSGEDILLKLKKYFEPLANAYSDICKQQDREFFGLRDFYSLIKMLCWIVQKSRTHLTRAQVEHAIKRNFSGYENHLLNPYEIFMSALKMKILPQYQAGDTATMKLLKNNNYVCLKSSDTDNFVVCQNGKLFFSPNYSRNVEFTVHINEDQSIIFESFAEEGCWISFNSEKQLTIVNSKCQAKKVFSLEHEEGKVSFCTDVSSSEFVELLSYDSFCIQVTNNSDINPNNTELELIKASLFTTEVGHGESRYLLFLTENFSAITTLKHFVLTSFEDNSKNQTGRNTNEELSKPYVLFGSSFPKDSEYAQVCRNISKIRLCMESGQMVILLNLENLYESLYDVLNQYYMESGGHRYVDLGLRAHRMKCRVHRNFKLILIAEKVKVYEDFPTPLINRLEKHFITSNTVLKDWQKDVCSELQTWVNAAFSNEDGFEIENAFVGYNADTSAAVTLQASLDLSGRISSVEGSQLWNKEILERCQKILLQLATPDAVIRAQQERTNQNGLSQVYFEEQEHSSLSTVIKHYNSSRKALIHVTTHSPMLLQEEIEELRQDLQTKHLERYHLESFQTETEFLEVINEGFRDDNCFKSHIILECDSGHLNGDLISCCRYRVLDKYNSPESSNCVIVLLVHIPRKYASSNFVSFQSKPWNCLHIDHLMESPISLKDFVVKKKSLSELFYDERADQSSLKLQTISDRFFCDQLDKCIHSAVSLILSSSKQRLISILKNFIVSKQSSSTVKDKGVFNALVIRCIANHLKKHEKSDASTLINSEASNFKQLQNAGTLVNAIVKSFEKTVVRVFADIISYVDQFCNLDILDKQKSDYTELWLAVFESEDLCQSKFSLTAKEDQAHKDHEKAKFPFSWLIYNFVSSRMSDTEKGVALFHDSELERVFGIIPPHSVDDLLRSYIHDFAFLAHRSVNAVGHKLLECSVLEMMKESFGEAKPSLLSAIVSVHEHYNTKKMYFDWFLKLASYVPQSILNGLEKQATIEDLITIVLVKVVESKSNDLTTIVNKEIDAIGTWLRKQYEMEQVITLILRKFCHQDQQIIQKWQWICTKRNFVESVVMKNKSNMSHFPKILDHYSKQYGELKDVATMNKVAIFLCTVENYLKKSQQGSSSMPDDQRRGIHKSCWEFFISVLSKFCFDSDKLPDKRLIDPLITSLFNNSEKKPKSAIDKFMGFHKEKVDDLRSIFIKLLLNYRYDDIEVFLEDILNQACTDVNQYSSLYITIISCLRDYTCASPDQWVLPDRDALLQESVNSPKFLFAVAQCWSCIYNIVNVVGSAPEQIIENQSMTFYFDSAKGFLIKAGVNDEMKTNAPIRFLIRLMVRLHGASWFLTQVEVHKTLDWMIPDEDLKQDSNTFLDIGAVYNPTYDKIRSAVSTVITSEGDISQLRDKAKTLNPQDAVSLALAFYEKVRLRLTSGGLPSTTFSDKVIQKFVEFSEQYKYFNDSSEVLETVRSIIENMQNSCFSKMQVSKRSGEMLEDFEADQCDVVRALVIHAVLSIRLNGKEELNRFLNLILKDPAQLKDSYFPCMPLRIPNLLTNGEDFPSCEDGHKNSVTMIGQHCHLCTKLIKESRAGMPSVITPQPLACLKFGYIPRKIGTLCVVGNLTCSSSSIIRVLIHSCLLWAACNKKDVSKLCDYLQPDYLWQEIEADLESLCRSIGRSVNEASILIHLVLKNINYNSYHFREKQNGSNILEMFKTDRDCINWELEFEKQYIFPVMNDIDHSLEESLGLLTVRDYNKLFGLVYKPSGGKCANDFLWRFHPTVTKNHFVTNSISLSLREKNPLMYMFMSEQAPLKATKYLPDIVKFQQRIQSVITDNFDQEVRKTVEEKTFLEFLEIAKIPEVEIQNTFESLQKAWKMCYQHLSDYDRWKVADFNMCSITADTKMKYLIPMAYGSGIITVALLDFLVNTHNSFVVHSRGYIVKLLGRDRYWNRKVSVANVNIDQLIDFEDNFLAVITAHSAQKFVGDAGCKIRYNIDEIEKDLVLKTVVGKPLIVRVADIPKPIWQKGLDIKLVIERVKKHIPQRPLTHQAKAEIYQELKTVAVVTEVQYTIRTVLSFIRRNLNPKQKIVQFMNELKMTEPLRCAKIKDYCYLENVVALWKLLEVQYARICVKNNENVFEDAPGSITDKLETGEHVDQKALLKKALEKMKKLEILIAVMFEFIEVQTATVIGQGETYSKVLRDELQEFILQSNLEPVPHLKEFFPDVITVSQVVDTWKELVTFHDNITK